MEYIEHILSLGAVPGFDCRENSITIYVNENKQIELYKNLTGKYHVFMCPLLRLSNKDINYFKEKINNYAQQYDLQGCIVKGKDLEGEYVFGLFAMGWEK